MGPASGPNREFHVNRWIIADVWFFFRSLNDSKGFATVPIASQWIANVVHSRLLLICSRKPLNSVGFFSDLNRMSSNF